MNLGHAFFFFFQAEDGIRDLYVTGVQTCALPICLLRPYGNLERYALKPIELFLPAPGRGLVPWRCLAEAYAEGALYRGEMGSAYLGLGGIAGLAAMAFSALRGWLRRKPGFLP